MKDFVAHVRARQDAGGSLLCVGLDPEVGKLPPPWRGDARHLFSHCAAVVDATRDLACAFKPQIAHFAAERAEDQLERLIDHCRRTAPDVPVILDAKRGDIGHTAALYAREAFERYRADALTLSPLMGRDSIEPFLAYDGKGLFLLCRTSNPGGDDLQALALAADGAGGCAGGGDGEGGGGLVGGDDGGVGGRGSGGDRRGEGGNAGNRGNAGEDADDRAPRPPERLYERIARLAAGPWNDAGRLGLVVGATYPRELARVRELAPALPLLVPGVGAQGGDAAATVRAAWRRGAPVLVNASRAVLHADPEAADVERSAAASRRAAQGLVDRLRRAQPAR